MSNLSPLLPVARADLTDVIPVPDIHGNDAGVLVLDAQPDVHLPDVLQELLRLAGEVAELWVSWMTRPGFGVPSAAVHGLHVQELGSNNLWLAAR